METVAKLSVEELEPRVAPCLLVPDAGVAQGMENQNARSPFGGPPASPNAPRVSSCHPYPFNF